MRSAGPRDDITITSLVPGAIQSYPGLSAMTVIEIISKSILVYTWLYPSNRDIASVNAIAHPSGYLEYFDCFCLFLILIFEPVTFGA
jgi:hypothetical protein